MIDWMLLILILIALSKSIARIARIQSVISFDIANNQTRPRHEEPENQTPCLKGEPAPTAHKTLSHLLDMQIKVTVFALMLG